MDYIDFLVDTTDEYLTGYFYKKRPISVEDGKITFKYKQLDPNSRVFGKVLGEVRSDRATYAIKTNDQCGFNIGGYIITQNGLIWQITEVITNEEVKGGNDVLRWFKRAKNAECSVRMVQIDDLFNINEAYNDMCEITVTISDDRRRTFNALENGIGALDYSVQGLSYIFEVHKGAFVEITTTYTASRPYEQVTHKISSNMTMKETYSVTYAK